MNTNVFLLLFSFVFSLSSTWERERERERERIYIGRNSSKGIGRNSSKVYLSLDDFPLESIFLSPFFFFILGLTAFILFLESGLKVEFLFPTCPRYFRLSFPGVLARASPPLVTTMPHSRLTFFLPTSADWKELPLPP